MSLLSAHFFVDDYFLCMRNIKITQWSKWLWNLNKNNNLIINRDYQRKGVWIKKDKIRLIESILLNLPIPEIYLWQRETNPENGETNYEIVDGQQRLTTLFDFISNEEFVLRTTYLEDET